MPAKPGEVLEKVRRFLYCNPSTIKEVAEQLGQPVYETSRIISEYFEHDHVRKLSSGAGFSNTTVYCLPGEEGLAEIKFSKLRNRYWQEQFDRENNVLKTIAENVLIGQTDIRRISGHAIDRKFLGRTNIQSIKFYNVPNAMKVTKYGMLYYIEGMEQAVAEKIASWIPPWDSLRTREKNSIGHFLNDLPEEIGKEVRRIASCDPQERKRKYQQRPDVKKRMREHRQKPDVKERMKRKEISNIRTLWVRNALHWVETGKPYLEFKDRVHREWYKKYNRVYRRQKWLGFSSFRLTEAGRNSLSSMPSDSLINEFGGDAISVEELYERHGKTGGESRRLRRYLETLKKLGFIVGL